MKGALGTHVPAGRTANRVTRPYDKSAACRESGSTGPCPPTRTLDGAGADARPARPAGRRANLRGPHPWTTSAAKVRGEMSTMPRTSLELPLRYRRRVLARLDDPIARAERGLKRRLAGAGRTVAPVAGPVRPAERRLDPPRRSRHRPLTGEPPSAGAGP